MAPTEDHRQEWEWSVSAVDVAKGPQHMGLDTFFLYIEPFFFFFVHTASKK